MPRTRALSSYPQEYWTMIEGCALRKETYALEMKDIKAALSIQGQFYAFRGALKRAQEKAQIRGLETEATRLEGLVNLSEITVCWIDKAGMEEGGPVKVRFMHRDNTPQADLLRQFLANPVSGQPAPVADSELEASQKELLEKLATTPKKGYM